MADPNLRATSISVLLCLILWTHCDRAPAQAAPASHPVKVLVDIKPKKGAPPDLDASKCTVSIDGKPSPLLSARPAGDDKLLFAVMVDISSSGRQQQKGISDTASRIFEALTHENSVGYLVLFNTQIYPTKRPILPAEARDLLNKISFHGGTSLYDSVDEVASGILSKSANPDVARRLIVLLSDGKDNYSKESFEAMQKTVQREGISVFALSDDTEDNSAKGGYLLEKLAQSTGGASVAEGMDPDDVRALVASIKGQTELTIEPLQNGDDQLHSLSVKASEKGLSIFAPDHILLR